MGVNHITGFLIQAADSFRRFILAGIVSVKVGKLLFHGFGNCIGSSLCKGTHKLPVLICIIPRNVINQPFQIAGNQDIHRRRRCQHKLPVPVVGSCVEEIIQHFIFIRSAYQPVYGKPHLLCIISRQNIAKIPGWNRNVYLFSGFYLSFF